jgi:hypothetical protein
MEAEGLWCRDQEERGDQPYEEESKRIERRVYDPCVHALCSGACIAPD